MRHGDARRVALVTGGASGIGRAVAVRLAARRHAVAILDRDGAGAYETAELCRRQETPSLALSADVTRPPEVEEALGRVRSELGAVSVLVTCAGFAEWRPFIEIDEDRWDSMLDVHLSGTYRMLRLCLPDMIAARWGRVVTVASVAGISGSPGFAHYAAAKGGIIALTKSVALEVGRHGITANVVAPGLVDTPMPRRSGMTDEVLARIAAASATGRLGTPEDVAAVCAFLASDEAGFITGQVISPNGGQYT